MGELKYIEQGNPGFHKVSMAKLVKYGEMAKNGDGDFGYFICQIRHCLPQLNL